MYTHAIRLVLMAAMVTGGMASVAEAQSGRNIVRYFARRYLDNDDRGRRGYTTYYRGDDYGDGYYAAPQYGGYTSRYADRYYSDPGYYGYGYNDYGYSQYDHMSDVEFVEHLYREILGREPDDIGVDHWIHQLRLGMPRHVVVHQFANSRERRLLDRGWNSGGYEY